MAQTSASAGALLRHVRTGRARSRADLVALTGASRNTVSARVDQLIAANFLEEGGRGWSTGGRPPVLLQFNSRAGCVLAVDLGVTSVDVAVTDLSARILATVGHPIDIADGPGVVLAEVDRLAQQVLAEAGLTPADVCVVGVGVPGPVEFSTGRPSYPPIMPGWHDYPIPSAFGRYECPVYVD
ncbi:MAG TPA: ROK family protein, partial [Blastococcus sp.]